MERLSNYLKPESINSLNGLLKNIIDFTNANSIISDICGIHDFFLNAIDYSDFLDLLIAPKSRVQDAFRREFGDFQTPVSLAEQICFFLNKNNVQPEFIIEPTFGKGSFILSSLKFFDQVKEIIGIEIYEDYIWHTKFKILEYFLEHPYNHKPAIKLIKADVFKYELNQLSNNFSNSVLVIGNPPWVTNAELSTLSSHNLPRKSNFKNYKGIDAITGKGNFDIGEYITLLMLKHFGGCPGNIGFLLKNSVIKNIVFDLKENNYSISNIKSYAIEAKKYFNAAVDASLFTASFNADTTSYTCHNFNFNNPAIEISRFGWLEDKFIANLNLYENNSKYDSLSPFEWRQGVKHDSAKVFELTKIDGKLYNGFHEEVDLEEGLIFGLIKSSDLKNVIISGSRKYVIITQKVIGQDTSYISSDYPRLYRYLKSKEDIIDLRKSSIYKNKPPFSIFGIGEYAFKPFKIAISGLYKKPSFSLLLPVNNKPLMADDTCYFLGFDLLSDALFTLAILNDSHVINLLKAISFQDAKRPFTKDILMRIAIDKIAIDLGFDYFAEKIKSLNSQFSNEISSSSWESYVTSFSKPMRTTKQLSLA